MSEALFPEGPIGTFVAAQVGGGTPSRQNPGYWNGPIPWASVKDFNEGQIELTETDEYITQQGLASSATNLIPANTPIVCTRMAVGRVAIAPMDVGINQDLKALFPTTSTDTRYLLRLADYAKPRAEAVSVGSTVKGIKVADYLNIRVPLAPPSHQSKIAEILDTLDTAIRGAEAVVAKLKAMKHGLRHDLLTRGIDANGDLRLPQPEAPHLYKQTPLGWLPKEWDSVELDQIVDNQRPVVYGILMPGHGYEGGVPVIKVRDIVGGRILADQLLLTNPRIDFEYRRSRLKGGDLLFTIRGSVGRMAIVPDDLENANITQDTARLALKGVDARFVAAFLETEITKRFISNHTIGVAVQGINLRDVRRIPMAKPTEGEDVVIADKLSEMERKLSLEIAEFDKLRLQKFGLMDDLLIGRTPVTALL